MPRRVGPSVWEISTARMAPNTVADLLVVDPDTFADAADWRDSFADASLESLLQDVADSEPFDLSVIVAGNYTDQFPDTGEMEVGNGLFMRYRVVGRIAAAPWLRERSSIAIVSQHAIAPLIPTREGVVPGPSNTVGLDRLFRTYVWSNSSQAELSAAVGAAALDTESPNVSTEERQPAFVAFRLVAAVPRVGGSCPPGGVVGVDRRARRPASIRPRPRAGDDRQDGDAAAHDDVGGGRWCRAPRRVGMSDRGVARAAAGRVHDAPARSRTGLRPDVQRIAVVDRGRSGRGRRRWRLVGQRAVRDPRVLDGRRVAEVLRDAE